MKKQINKNYLEWAVFGLSTLIIVVLLGYLTQQAFIIHEESPPEISLETGKPINQPGKFMVPITIINNGEQTAEDVNIVVTLEKDGQQVEESVLVVAFVPRHSQTQSYAVFINDPAQYKVFAKTTGFNVP